jgi:hypothetical protein
MWDTEKKAQLFSIYERYLNQVNVPSADDGFRFTDFTRINEIKSILANSQYQLRYDGYVSLIYQHRNFDPKKDSVLISSHIDSLHPTHFIESLDDNTWAGSFDNSATNAAVLTLMTSELLSPQVMIAFTGDEENTSHGVHDVVAFFEKNPDAGVLDAVICLDVSNFGYQNHAFTIENWFESEEGRYSHLNNKKIKKMLRNIFPNALMKDAEDEDEDHQAWPDESWAYDELDVFCFSICLPVGPHPKYVGDQDYFMESDLGMLLKKSSPVGYLEAIIKATQMLGC